MFKTKLSKYFLLVFRTVNVREIVCLPHRDVHDCDMQMFVNLHILVL